MSQPIRFDGKVVLITGAGNGLGKAYALAFAERGASVVVNDLGGDMKGSGASQRAADKVVDEIKAKGGKAVANYDSVENGEKVVQTALDHFGRIDVVVNNAGILRDRSFARISNEDWDLIQRVHLRGSFLVTRAAWSHMRKQNFGRIIMVSSAAGIYGNFGQANYSAAKLGLVGLSKTLALEGAKYNIKCNTVAPMAGSRLTETVMPPEMLKALKPEFVCPVVMYLCHDSTEETGGIFEVGAGWIGKLRWERTEGVSLRKTKGGITPESVRDSWDQITDFSQSTYPTSTQESSTFMMNLLQKESEEEGKADEVEISDPVAAAKKTVFTPTKFSYSERDAILYALGVGVSTSQEDHLKFLFELAEDFTVLPSFGVIPAFEGLMSATMTGIKGFKIDPTKILHGEQYLEVFKPFPRSGVLKSKVQIVDVLDKKSGALFLYNVETFDENNEKVTFNQFSSFLVGAGGFGGQKNSSAATPLGQTPSRAPDAVMAEKTSIDQAALYRLSGDRNPLHIDPNFAAMGGFKTPILHGLCSFGYAVRHVMKKFANNDMTRFKAVKVRFAKPVLPGQTLETSMWKEGNRIYFQTKVVESSSVCISGAYVDLKEGPPSESVKQESSGLKSSAMFQLMAPMVKTRPELTSKVDAVFLWNITQNGKKVTSWVVDLKNGRAGEIYEGSPRSGKADCTVTVSDDNFSDLVTGKLNPQQAFMSGKLKLAGNVMLAQKLGELFALGSKL